MSLVSDVTDQVKHPRALHAQSIHHSRGLKLKCFFFIFITSKVCGNEDMLCIYVIQFGRQ